MTDKPEKQELPKDLTINQCLSLLEKAIVKGMNFIEDINRDDINTLLKAFRAMSEHVDKLDDLHKVYAAVKQRYSTEVIPQIFESHGFDSIKSGGYNFIKTAKLRANIPSEKREQGFDWLKANNLGELIQETVNANSLTAAINSYLEQKGELPPETAVTTYTQVYTQIRKG